MGVTLNICKIPPSPLLKARAEELAVYTQESLTDVYLGTSQFDKAGQYYWQADLDVSILSIQKAFQYLLKAKHQFKDILKIEFELYQSSSEKLEGINEDLFYGFSHLDDMFRKRVRGIENIIQIIDHLDYIEAEKYAIKSLEANDIRGVYKAVSNTSRELLQAALELHGVTLQHSKTTHETSDLLKTIYDLKPLSNNQQ